MRKILVLLFALGFPAIGVFARNGVQVSFSYLPVGYPKYDSNNMSYYSAVVNGLGGGVDYRLTVPLLSSSFVLKTGLGFTYSRIDESGNSDFYIRESMTGGSGAQEIVVNADYEAQRSYSYACLPVNLGYDLKIGNESYLTPYGGLQIKYNISYVEKYSAQHVTMYDRYFELFDDDAIKESDAKRFIFQYDLGVEMGFRNMFMTVCYSKDLSRLFSVASFSRRNIGVWGPYELGCWQIGVGVNF
jgi:hypothetical protein